MMMGAGDFSLNYFIIFFLMDQMFESVIFGGVVGSWLR
jgi:hypothetical protein